MKSNISDKLHIGIVGPANPSAFGCYFDNMELPAMYTNTTAVSTYVVELLRNGHTVSIFTDTYDDNKVSEYHANRLHIYIVPRVIRKNGLRTFSPLLFHLKLRRYISAHINGIDVLHAQWTYEYALAASHFAKTMPVFCTVRDWCPYILSLQKGWKLKLRWLFYLFIFRRVMANKDIHFIANSEYTYSLINTEYPEKDLEIIYNPIDKDVILDMKKKEIDHPVFITICHIVSDYRKNIATLIKAFAHFRKKHLDAELIIVGEYDKDSYIYNMAIDMCLMDGVKFIGRIPHEQLMYMLDNATCLVHPSYEETFGNILIEGMSRCIPCIGGRYSGAVPQVLDNGRCGVLCDVTDVQDLLRAMENIQDRDYRNMIVQNASNRLRSLFVSDITMQRTLDIYRKYI